MGVERSGASVWDDAERRCELSFQMGNGEFPISARYLPSYSVLTSTRTVGNLPDRSINRVEGIGIRKMARG